MVEYFKNKKICSLRDAAYPNDSLAKPNMIYSFKDYIIIVEPKLDDMLSVFNTQTQKYNRFLSRGKGPNELLDVQQIDSYAGTDIFFIKSTFGKDIFVYSLEDEMFLSHSKVPIRENTVSLFHDDSLIISTQYGIRRYSVYMPDTSEYREFGTDLELNGFSQDIVSYILQGLCAGNSKHKKFVWFSIYGDAFEIYDYKDLDNIKNIKQYTGIMPIVKNEGSNPVFSVKSKLGVPSLTSNDNYIFALYNENTLEDAITLRDEVFLSNKILVIDWNGDFVMQLELDKPIRSISYNKEKKELVCLGHDENFNYKVFYLKESDIF